MGFHRHEYWSGLPFPPPGNLTLGSSLKIFGNAVLPLATSYWQHEDVFTAVVQSLLVCVLLPGIGNLKSYERGTANWTGSKASPLKSSSGERPLLSLHRAR